MNSVQYYAKLEAWHEASQIAEAAVGTPHFDMAEQTVNQLWNASDEQEIDAALISLEQLTELDITAVH